MLFCTNFTMTHMNGIRLNSKQPGGYLQGQADGKSLRDAWSTWGDTWQTGGCLAHM